MCRKGWPRKQLRFKEFGLALDVPISYVDVGCEEYELPMLKPSTLFQHFADIGRIDLLFGEQPRSALVDFWERYEHIEGDHPVFARFRSGELVPARCVPMYCHGDEGRGKKRRQIMVFNTHAAIGRGSQPFLTRHEHQPELRATKQGLNLLGHSSLTRHLVFALPRGAYGPESRYLFRMIDEVAQDYKRLATKGFRVDGEIFHVIILGCVGDLQFHSKVGSFDRCYTHVAKRTGHKQGGVCHICRAGESGILFEDFSYTPAWRATQGVVPWQVAPTLLSRLDHSPSNLPGFFKPDCWHCFHLGVGRRFLSSAFAELLPFLPGCLAASFSIKYLFCFAFFIFLVLSFLLYFFLYFFIFSFVYFILWYFMFRFLFMFFLFVVIFLFLVIFFFNFIFFYFIFFSVLFFYFPFCSVIFCSVLFCSFIFFSFLFCSVLFSSFLFFSFILCSFLFFSLLFLYLF